MFTGIIRELGSIQSLSKKGDTLKLSIEGPKSTQGKKEGDSIAVDGVCLTITDINPPVFETEIMEETLGKTIIGKYREGSLVNLENPVKIGETLDGHFVTGHTDFTGEIIDTSSNELIIKIPGEFLKYFALKGSVAVNGVSLTVSKIENDNFTVSLIPETLKKTNLGKLQKGDSVNLEIDLIIRYLESLLSQKEQQISHDFLKERGFI